MVFTPAAVKNIAAIGPLQPSAVFGAEFSRLSAPQLDRNSDGTAKN
jgi:hypothetical protein